MRPVGQWAMYPAVNPPSREPGVDKTPRLLITEGATPGELLIRMRPDQPFLLGMRPDQSAPIPGRLGAQPGTLVFTDGVEQMRFTCRLTAEGGDHVLIGEYGEPQQRRALIC